MATEQLGKERPSKLLDALILHKPIPVKRKRGYTTFSDSTSDLIDDDKGLHIGEVNLSNLDSVESVTDEVLCHCVFQEYISTLKSLIFYRIDLLSCVDIAILI